jgi:hypothetical protein
MLFNIVLVTPHIAKRKTFLNKEFLINLEIEKE